MANISAYFIKLELINWEFLEINISFMPSILVQLCILLNIHTTIKEKGIKLSQT